MVAKYRTSAVKNNLLLKFHEIRL